MSLRASLHDGFVHGFSGSTVTQSRWRWNSSRTQSMILMMRWGGFASLRTIEQQLYRVTHINKSTVENKSHLEKNCIIFSQKIYNNIYTCNNNIFLIGEPKKIDQAYIFSLNFSFKLFPFLTVNLSFLFTPGLKLSSSTNHYHHRHLVRTAFHGFRSHFLFFFSKRLFFVFKSFF